MTAFTIAKGEYLKRQSFVYLSEIIESNGFKLIRLSSWEMVSPFFTLSKDLLMLLSILHIVGSDELLGGIFINLAAKRVASLGGSAALLVYVYRYMYISNSI
jgi:hypothetical protein